MVYEVNSQPVNHKLKFHFSFTIYYTRESLKNNIIRLRITSILAHKHFNFFNTLKIKNKKLLCDYKSGEQDIHHERIHGPEINQTNKRCVKPKYCTIIVKVITHFPKSTFYWFLFGFVHRLKDPFCVGGAFAWTTLGLLELKMVVWVWLDHNITLKAHTQTNKYKKRGSTIWRITNTITWIETFKSQGLWNS